MQERIPAQNIEAEQAVLGAILIDNRVLNNVAEILKSPDFYRIVHQIIYQTMLDMHAKHQPIDLITLIEELKNRNKLDDVGGVSYITLLANIVPTSANALYHARIVVNNALLRQLGESGAAITALSFEKEEDIQSLIDRAEQTLHAVSLRKHGKAFVPIHDILTHTMDRMTSLQTKGETVTGLSTGFADLDKLTTGLHPSDFIILAARPSMGKTALALNIAQNVALRGAKQNEAPKRVAFFSLEMRGDQ
uniref:DnaB-like helicase N-terminal domain-containing protein n=1 Tax=uncultured Acidaminococcus sp. TaxID=352152 RepID=UPI00258590CC